MGCFCMLDDVVNALQPLDCPAGGRGLIAMLPAGANAGLVPSHLNTCDSTPHDCELFVSKFDCLTKGGATLLMHIGSCMIGHLHRDQPSRVRLILHSQRGDCRDDETPSLLSSRWNLIATSRIFPLCSTM